MKEKKSESNRFKMQRNLFIIVKQLMMSRKIYETII